MGDYRSKSYFDGNNNNDMQIERYYASRPTSSNLRSYSAAASYPPPPPTHMGGGGGGGKELKFKKGKSVNGSSSSNKSWGLNDPEFQRKKRVASYKVYSVERKVKGSFRKSFRWIKYKYTQVVYGWW